MWGIPNVLTSISCGWPQTTLENTNGVNQQKVFDANFPDFETHRDKISFFAEQDCANWIDHNLRFILTASLIYPLSWKPVSFAMNLFHSFAPAQPSPSPSSGSGKSCSKIFLMLIADSSLILYRPFSRSVYIGVLENDRCLISFHSCDADADGVYIGVLGVDWYYISFHSWPTAAAVYFKATGVSLNIFILLSPQVFVSEEILWISTEHHNSKKLIVFLENSNN